MARETIEKVRDDVELEEELEMLLDEIPHATSHNLLRYHHHHRHGHGDDDGGAFVTKQTQYGHGHGHGMYYDDDFKSPISGFFLQSDGSSSSLFSSSPPPFEDLKSSVASRSSYYPNTTTTNNNSNLFFDPKIPDSTVKLNEAERLVHELSLCANFSKMHVADNNNNNNNNRRHNPNVLTFRDFVNHVHNTRRGGDCTDFERGFCDSVGFQSPFTRTRSPIAPAAEINSALSGLTQDHKIPNLFGSSLQPCTGWREHNSMVSQLNGFSAGSMDSLRCGSQLMNDYHFRGGMAPELVGSLSRSPAFDSSFYAQKYLMNLLEERGGSRLPNNSFCGNFKPCVSVQELLQYGLFQPNPNARGVPLSNARIPQGNLDAITSEGSFIIQGEGLNYVGVSRGSDHSWCQRAVLESGFAKQLPRSELDIQHQITGYENPRSPRNACSFPLLPNYNSLAEAQGLIYLIAKDQHGCRFLQRIFDEGTPEDVQVIFNEIIDHVVELMMNPFGNYLMQKLLDVCDENQRMQMILMVTEEPGQLVRISLNTHGTRVVQKVIETLKTRQQISLVVAALEPGFLALIKDLNGNHVVQHCLQCLSNEDNKFIFVAAAKYCVDIATHQHGCCVLQRCIGHSRGEHREKLVEEISANALLLAQDQFGNYVVQFILDLRIPSATATLSLQFEGKYVHLSMQKFGSHVVEKCLAVFNDENRSRVIHELLSAPHFEQLLQDPHANYVIQSAVRHSEGHVHNLLVEAIESHKAISRNSPYSKKIFSQKLLKK
ncbi:putative pumilio 7, chloroplastic [Glycine soja]